MGAKRSWYLGADMSCYHWACPNAERKKVFDKIRPLCVQLTKEHSRVNVQAINTALTNVDRTVIQDLQEYLLFPFRLILKQDKKYPDELYVDVFTSIEKVLSQTRVSQWEMFQDIFNTCCLTISSPAEVGKVKPLSEELKTVIVQTLMVLVRKSEYRALKIKAMECLIEISQVDGKYCSKVKTMLGDTFASFLPGVSITLCQVITGDSKQGQTVIITALKTWASIVTMVMDDKLIEEAQIRSRIVEWAARLLEHCSKSLKDCIPTILEVLVGLIGDEYSHVALYSRKVLESFSSSHLGHECRPLVEMLEENLHQLTVSLPRLIRASDESQKLGTASLLSGYIALLGPNVNSLLRSSSHLKRLSLSLIQVLELDCSDVKIVEERTHLIGHGASAVNSKEIPDILQPKKYFRHFHDKKIYHEFRNVCRLLGYYGVILLDDFYYDQAALFMGVLNELVKAVSRWFPCLALETLVIMSECTGDFIKRRTVTDVFPKLIHFLDKQAQISCQFPPPGFAGFPPPGFPPPGPIDDDDDDDDDGEIFVVQNGGGSGGGGGFGGGGGMMGGLGGALGALLALPLILAALSAAQAPPAPAPAPAPAPSTSTSTSYHCSYCYLTTAPSTTTDAVTKSVAVTITAAVSTTPEVVKTSAPVTITDAVTITITAALTTTAAITITAAVTIVDAGTTTLANTITDAVSVTAAVTTIAGGTTILAVFTTDAVTTTVRVTTTATGTTTDAVITTDSIITSNDQQNSQSRFSRYLKWL
ncbi:TTI1 [Mytilus edulis]|uniref:TTI1 n=1 Tax=Mytilus edulis TaxID=6550 RepID=A0A8S3T6P5_MYTED|nr:TTI1 [Mytilus edulis]